MSSGFRISVPFEKKPPRLKGLVNQHVMGDVWVRGRKRSERKVDMTEFGLVLLLLYINSPEARRISAEILYRFFILKTYIAGLNDRQLGALKGYYRKQMS